MDFFFFLFVWVFLGLLVLFYSSHTHILFPKPPVFVSHLLASSSHVLAVVLLWSLVCVCWWPCMWNVEGFLVKCSKSRKPHIRPSLSTNKKQESATCLGARCSSLPRCSWQKHGKRNLCEKFQQGEEEWALLVSRGVLQWCVAANWWGVGSALSRGWAGKYQMPLRLDSQCKNQRH